MLLRWFATRGCQSLTCKNVTFQRTTASRYMHIVSGPRHVSVRHSLALNNCKRSGIAGTLFIRHESTDKTVPETLSLPEIPDAPASIQQTIEAVSALSANGEPTFASLGLGGYSPTGLIQSGLEWLHVTYDVPWFAAIAAGTLMFRLMLFPLIIKSQRNSAHLSHYMPQIQAVQERMAEGRRLGDYALVAEASQEMMKLYESRHFKPFQTILLPVVQIPIFISVFFALREMANLPVESLKHGGIWWFTDLTVPDPYYLLPIITCATVYVTFNLNSEVGFQQHKLMRYAPIAIPLVMLPFMTTFPAALPCYWTTTNLFTLAQVALLRTKWGRNYFNIPERYKAPAPPQTEKKSFMQGFKDSIEQLRFTKRVNDKLQADEMRFNRAGGGPIPKTFDYDPSKPPSYATGARTNSKR